jgi:hypothetical protein
MLDSSAQRNFILLETIKQLNIFIREKEELYLFSIIQVMLDSSTQRNFILLETIKQLNIFIREKEELYLFSIINRIIIKQDKGIV